MKAPPMPALPLWALAASLHGLALAAPAQPAPSQVLRLDQPTVVFLSPAHRPSQDPVLASEEAEFESDFVERQMQVRRLLAHAIQLDLRASRALTLQFAGKTASAAHHDRLATQAGVVVYVPGQAPVVLPGIPDASQVVCAAVKLQALPLPAGMSCP